MTSRHTRWKDAVRRAKQALEAGESMLNEWRTILVGLHPELKALQQRWAEQLNELKAALIELENLQEDFKSSQERMNLAENLSDANAATEEKVDAVINIYVEGERKSIATLKLFPAEEAIEEAFEVEEESAIVEDNPLDDLFELIAEAESVDLPKFYGRD